jgi:hypothetical protein
MLALVARSPEHVAILLIFNRMPEMPEYALPLFIRYHRLYGHVGLHQSDKRTNV